MTSFINFNLKEKHEKGFTLLELLIVIAIIAILSIALVFMLNPAETLKKARDAQRISDLKSVKTALGIMLTASSTPSLDGYGSVCLTSTTPAGVTTANASAKISYSYDGTVACTGVGPTAGIDAAGGTAAFGPSGSWCRNGVAGSVSKVDGTGWIPVNLKALTGGTPISSYPVDPVNMVSATTPNASDLVYRYACQNGTSATVGSGKPAYIFEINAVFESNAYTSEDNKMSKDGGDNNGMYESGNSLYLLPASGAF